MIPIRRIDMVARDKKALIALKEIQRFIDAQSDDKELWEGKGDFKKELKKLHDVIERFTIPLFEAVWLTENDKNIMV